MMRYGTRDLPSVEVGVFSEFWIYFFYEFTRASNRNNI